MHVALKRRVYWVLAVVALLALGGAGLAMTSGVTSAGSRGPARSPGQINPANFVKEVDNEFFPLEPGTTFYYEGTTDGVPTNNVTYVTHDTKRILGVKTTVVHDRAYEDGVLVEDTFDWYAQDRAGNVWYFGEDTKELDEDGNVISTEGSWKAGVDGAQPGIIVRRTRGSAIATGKSWPRVWPRIWRRSSACTNPRAFPTTASTTCC